MIWRSRNIALVLLGALLNNRVFLSSLGSSPCSGDETMGLPKEITPSSYRAFLRDGHGHIEKVVPLDCDGDGKGREAARAFRGSSSVELWQGARLVCRFDGDGNELPLFDN
jgi:hypothetical protein